MTDENCGIVVEACTGTGPVGAPRVLGRSIRGPRGVGFIMTEDPAGTRPGQ